MGPCLLTLTAIHQAPDQRHMALASKTRTMDITLTECTNSAETHGQIVARLIGSGLVQRLVPVLALRDLQSFVNVCPALREWTDSLPQPNWQAIRARLVPASHYLASVVIGLSTATRGQTESLHPLQSIHCC